MTYHASESNSAKIVADVLNDHDSETGDAARGGIRVVGIGASAGGLDAFTRLLRQLPTDTGCAYVIVQHLDATHPSSLREILGRATPMPVIDATDGMAVSANRVFVIPPNAEMTIDGRVLRLAPRRAGAPQMTIDRFLQSLAADCGDRAVGIILSGNGSDGTIGLSAIKDAGGTTFAQEPSTAEFPSMPVMAVAAGSVDVILPPEAIATELARIACHPLFIAPEPVETFDVDADQEKQSRAIFEIMRAATGIDFSLYRQTTVQRRIRRRLAIRNIATLGEFTRLLAADPEERGALQRDLLIGVTKFFRDPDSFDVLKKTVFPTIVRDRHEGATIRIWVPGCASGEEPYSILMALQEFQEGARTAFPVQVFASDINETALAKARAGKYPASSAVDVGPGRLRAHFWNADGGYQVSKELRAQCVFSRHNLLDDPPFSRLDLISCRNVLIYLDAVQRKVIPLFHYALVEGGFLMLGRSETARYPDLFAPVESRERIYVKRQVARKPYGSFARGRTGVRGDDANTAERLPRRVTVDLSREIDRLLLAKYNPAGVLVDDGLQVLEVRGYTAPFLSLGAGKSTHHLLKLVPDTGLFLEIETLMRAASISGEPARRDLIKYEANGRGGEVSVEVTPLGSEEQRAHFILFELADPAGADDRRANRRPVDPVEAIARRDAQIVKLTRELETVRSRLMAMADEHETSDEESQQITEDALSSNEELQSLTEELETAKEELQSTNEELITVNRELESRNAALASALDVTKSIVETVRIPLMVVDHDVRVLQINAAFGRSFPVAPGGGEGRRLYELSDGAWDAPALRAAVDALLEDGKAFEAVEIAPAFSTTGVRVLLVSGCRLEQLGSMLISVEDVTDRRQAEQALRAHEDQRRQSEKMETIGRLAGGIAHDFNNLLTVIVGDAELVRDTLGPDHEAIAQIGEICSSAEKAAALTDQLLSFSRRKVLQPTVFDLNLLVTDFERMLRRVVGEHIKIVIRSTPRPCLVTADIAEIGRVLMNLGLNARDSMPAGGTLTIETAHVHVDARATAAAGIGGGDYVSLIVGDTGLGMDAETQRRAFEPFFTTKDVSSGAGLGLSTVFGIVQQSGGTVSCDSELGHGTRFTVRLPLARDQKGSSGTVDRRLVHAPTGSREVVLLVEDQEDVRRLTKVVLERSGYVVLEATDGRQGLAMLQSYSGQVDILVSDVLMPEMSGGMLADRAMLLRPTLRVLFMSGHTEDVLVREGVTRGMAFLRKPFRPAELVLKVREVLDTPQRPS